MRCTPDAQNDACPTCDGLLLAENRMTRSRQKMPHNKALHLTVNPLRGLSAADAER